MISHSHHHQTWPPAGRGGGGRWNPVNLFFSDILNDFPSQQQQHHQCGKSSFFKGQQFAYISRYRISKTGWSFKRTTKQQILLSFFQETPGRLDCRARNTFQWRELSQLYRSLFGWHPSLAGLGWPHFTDRELDKAADYKFNDKCFLSLVVGWELWVRFLLKFRILLLEDSAGYPIVLSNFISTRPPEME